MKKTIRIFACVVAALALASSVANYAFAQDAARLAQEKRCMACHDGEKKLVGPSYQDIAAKYRDMKKHPDQKGAEAKLAKAIREGGYFGWGRIPMPPTAMSENEASILAKWVMAQKMTRPTAAGRSSAAASKPQSVVVGTLADTVLEWRGKSLSTAQVGRDDNGLLVEWRYPDATYLMGRRLHGGIEAYRVIKITPM